MNTEQDIRAQVPQWMTLAVSLLLFLKVVVKYAYRSLLVISKNYPNASCTFNSCCGLFKGSGDLSESERDDAMDIIHGEHKEEPKEEHVDTKEHD